MNVVPSFFVRNLGLRLAFKFLKMLPSKINILDHKQESNTLSDKISAEKTAEILTFVPKIVVRRKLLSVIVGGYNKSRGVGYFGHFLKLGGP